MYVNDHRCPGCMSMITDVLDVYRWMWMLTNVLDVCWCSPMSWIKVNSHRCPGCMSTLINVLDVWRCSLMSWMCVDALRCPGCMSMITDVLDVCWCFPMTWMYMDLLINSSKFLLSMYSNELWFLSANMSWKKTFLTTRNPLHQGLSIDIHLHPGNLWNNIW